MTGKCSVEAFERSAALKNVTSTETEESTNLVPLGIVVGLTASIVINVAQNCIARGWGVTFWTVAFAIACISNFVAFSFAPGSVLSPLEGAQFVTNLLFHMFNGNAAILHPTRERVKERNLETEDGKQVQGYSMLDPARIKWYGWKVIIGTIFVLGGVVLPVLGGAGAPAPVFDEQAIECFWKQRTSIVYHASLSGVAIVSFLLWFGRKRSGRSDKDKKVDTLMEQYLWRYYGCETPAGIKAGKRAIAKYASPAEHKFEQYQCDACCTTGTERKRRKNMSTGARRVWRYTPCSLRSLVGLPSYKPRPFPSSWRFCCSKD